MLDLDWWKLYKTICQGVLKTEKLEKEKCTSNCLNIIISHFKYGVLTTFLSMIFLILILEYRNCYFWILQRLGCWKMYRNTFQDDLEAEKWAKPKWVLFLETPSTRSHIPATAMNMVASNTICCCWSQKPTFKVWSNSGR